MEYAIKISTNEKININLIDSSGFHPELKCICCNQDIVVAKLGTKDINPNGKAKHFAHLPNTTEVNEKAYNEKLNNLKNNDIHKRAQYIVSQLTTITVPRMLDLPKIKSSNLLKDLDENILPEIKLIIPNKYVDLKILSSEIEKKLNSLYS